MRIKKSNGKNKKARGRPDKKTKNRLNVGKKKIEIGNVSTNGAIYRRANEILNYAEQNIATIELAAKIGRKRSITKNTNINGDLPLSDAPKIIKHTNESALAFYLEHDFSRKSYEALAKDSKEKNSSVYPCYENIQKAMFNCKPLHYESCEI